MHAWLVRLGCVAFSLAAAGELAVAANANPPPSPVTLPPGIKIELLAAGQSGPTRQGTVQMRLLRITYAPGAAFDYRFPGPVLFYIEQGTLQIDLNQGHVAITRAVADSGNEGFIAVGAEPATLDAGFALYADDGYVGATRNPGSMQAIVLVDSPMTTHDGSSRHKTATVIPATPMP